MKDIHDFYKHKGNSDGHSYSCSDCMLKACREYCKSEQGNNIRHTYNQTDKCKEMKKAYERSEAGQKVRKRNLNKFPEKRKARKVISNAIRDGKLPKVPTLICEICGNKADEYHHYKGYAPKNRFDVIPLCRSCHIIEG